MAHDDAAAGQLDSITDRTVDKEMDAEAAKAALLSISSQGLSEREQELAKVVVAAADVKVVQKEFEVSEEAAGQVLRENGGDLKRALRAMLQQ